jgi:predicted CopG family antitoxin
MNFQTQSQGMIVLHRFNLFKRLESSVYSFSETIRRLLERINRTIESLESGGAVDEDKDVFEEEEAYLEGKYEIEVKHLRVVDYLNDLEGDRIILEKIYNEAKFILDEDRDKKISELQEIIPKLKRPSDKKKARDLFNSAQAIAANLYDIHLTGAREDAFRSPMKLYGRLSALASDIGSFGVDFKPTDQQRDVYGIFNKRLENTNTKFEKFMKVEVPKLNSQIKKSELQILGGEKIKS